MPAVTKIREDETAPKKERMLIGGKWLDSASGEWLEVEDPAHRRPIAEVPRGRSEDVARGESRGRCLSRLVAHGSSRARAASRPDSRCT